MNADDVRSVMAVAAAIDPYMPAADDDVIAVWVAMLHDVPAKVGAPAVHWYYRSDAYRDHRRTITPGDIFGYYKNAAKDWRQRRTAKEITAARAAIEAAPREIPSLSVLFARYNAERKGADPDIAEGEAAARRLYMGVACPHPTCRAQPGQQCTGYTGRPLRKNPAHPARMDAAQIQHA
ncbi:MULTISPECIES: zinc finger domain-containing protein [Bacteria]|uniref:DNA-binding phage zinc finger domain-containing protein n=2 Tax=Bacteria TaxID=2 RepID=A0A1I4UIV8_9BURK|nr:MULTISPECIES: hypothetical protein [Bacteria]SFE69287.1 hypothetical protein SAMN05216506_113170 [Saccharopolyspora kobensis]SFM88942.1 hypothetical protein SAMN02982985_05677 [Rugamonas rubra]